MLRRDDLGSAESGGDGLSLRSAVGDRQHPGFRLLVLARVVLREGAGDEAADRQPRLLVHPLLLHDVVAALLGDGRGSPGEDGADAARVTPVTRLRLGDWWTGGLGRG